LKSNFFGFYRFKIQQKSKICYYLRYQYFDFYFILFFSKKHYNIIIINRSVLFLIYFILLFLFSHCGSNQELSREETPDDSYSQIFSIRENSSSENSTEALVNDDQNTFSTENDNQTSFHDEDIFPVGTNDHSAPPDQKVQPLAREKKAH
jgi:hypothetical protein